MLVGCWGIEAWQGEVACEHANRLGRVLSRHVAVIPLSICERHGSKLVVVHRRPQISASCQQMSKRHRAARMRELAYIECDQPIDDTLTRRLPAQGGACLSCTIWTSWGVLVCT